jgi:amino acid adenylation domain-containing protein
MPVIQPLFSTDAFPLSPAQERLWFLDQLDPGSPMYNIAVGLRLQGALDVAGLERSLNEIVRRHETLRTRFGVVDGLARQMVEPAVTLAFPVVDLDSLPEGQRMAEAERRAQAEAQQPFDLAVAPLIRVQLLRLHNTDHLLVVTVHHIVADGWSMGVFLRELNALYVAFSLGQPASLPELPVQYVDYAAWQREWLDTAETLAEQLRYWQQRMGGSLSVLELPADHPRPPIQSLRGAIYLFELSPAFSAELQALSRTEGVTLFMIFLAALQTLLFRYTGETDQRVGTPIANRPQPELQGLIGLFVNTLVLRQDLSNDPSFRDLLKRVRDTCLEAYTHQDVPFEKLVELVQPERDLSHTPLFQVMLAQQAPLPAMVLGDLRVHRLALDSGTAKFDLTLFFEDKDSGIECMWEYNCDIFERETIARFTEHFRMLLAGIVADPAQRLSRLALLSPAERQQVLLGWNTTAAAPPNVGLPALFEAQAERSPDAVAVVFAGSTNDLSRDKETRRQGDKETTGRTTDDDSVFIVHRSSFIVQLTYAELNQRANQLAHYLRQRGVGAETPVALCVERSVEMIVAVLGILKAGGAYLPLDPSYPHERLAFMLDDSRAAVLITTTKDEGRRTNDGGPTTNASPCHLVTLSPCHGTTVDLHADWPAIAQQPSSNPVGWTTAEHLAYVLYTSGSTGQPKGVAVAHRGAVALIQWAQEVFTSAELQRVLAATSLGFDLSVYEIFVPLSVGGALVLVEHALALVELDAAVGVTLVNSVPSALAELVRLKGIPPSVKTINLAGEPLGRALVDQLYAIDSVERVYNLYGPTEDTVYSTFALLPRTDSRPPSIGRPITNAQAYILDEHLEPAPVGVPGELYLGGAGLARGYLNRPDLTAERFVPNPFGRLEARDWRLGDGSSVLASSLQPPASRLYRTGDLARWRADGAIEFLGRRDQQVKLRGYRIELGEIEAALARHPRVQACVIAAPPAKAGERQLVGYIVPSNELPGTSNELTGTNNADSSLVTRHSSLAPELRDFLKERLPDYMVPSAFVVLEALPLTPNGKVDRRALPMPTALQRETSAEFVVPRTPVEVELARIWADVLGVERVGVNDNFFELGGHSLMVTQIMGQVRETFQVNLPLRSVFEKPTIAYLAQLIGSDRPVLQQPETPRIRAVPRRQGNMNELLNQLDQLSDEEVEALLAQRAHKRRKE